MWQPGSCCSIGSPITFISQGIFPSLSFTHHELLLNGRLLQVGTAALPKLFLLRFTVSPSSKNQHWKALIFINWVWFAGIEAITLKCWTLHWLAVLKWEESAGSSSTPTHLPLFSGIYYTMDSMRGTSPGETLVTVHLSLFCKMSQQTTGFWAHCPEFLKSIPIWKTKIM